MIADGLGEGEEHAAVGAGGLQGRHEGNGAEERRAVGHLG